MLNTSGTLLQSNKEHKFFEKHLDNNLDELARFLEAKYKLITEAQLRGVSTMENDEGIWLESGSLSTVKWREYNVFQLYHPSLHKLYSELAKLVKEACSYYEIDFDKQKYYVQGWFNINEAGNGKLNWHDHGAPGAPNFHGYYCVKAEPSSTYYRLFGDPNREVENKNIDNRMIVSEMGHPHAQGDWDWPGSRITVAYDIQPLSSLLLGGGHTIQQHWIPLL
jgi:hypothetical protein